LNSTDAGLTISCWVNTAGANTGKIMRIFDIPLQYKKTGIVVDISGSNMIYSRYIDKTINITSDLSIPFSTNGLPLTPTTTYNAIATTDYGDIIIATSIGIYYSRDLGNTFTRSMTTVCSSVSMNNTGNALACNLSNIYYSSDYGISWITANNTINSNIKRVFVTQTGLSYILCHPTPIGSTATLCKIYSSNDFFKTNNALMYDTTVQTDPWCIIFSSNGNGAFFGNNFLKFYSVSSSTWVSGGTGPNIGGGISDNGYYIGGMNLDSILYFKNLTPPSYNIDTNWTRVNLSQTGTMGLSIGNNGVVYFTSNSGLLKFKNSVVTNTGYPAIGFRTLPISPSGTFAITYSSNNLIIIAS
jgi:hypothetical protein